MAGIDKTYTDKYQDYLDLINWSIGKRFKCYNGDIISPLDYIYTLEEINFNHGEIPVMNTPCELDYFLIKECPLEFVQNTMKRAYSDSYYEIKNGTSEYDTFTKEGKYSTKFKVIDSPDKHGLPKLNIPLLARRYSIGINIDRYHGLWYNSDTNKWVWDYELSPWNTNRCDKYKTIKAVKRAIRKWKLPKGAIVKVIARYVDQIWKFKMI